MKTPKRNQGFVQEAGYTLLLIALILGLSWVFTGNDFFLYKFFAPKEEQVRHDVFKNSQAYNDGMANELQDLQIQYSKGTPEVKQIIASDVVHRAASYDTNRLPFNLQQFIETCRSNQIENP